MSVRWRTHRTLGARWRALPTLGAGGRTCRTLGAGGRTCRTLGAGVVARSTGGTVERVRRRPSLGRSSGPGMGAGMGRAGLGMALRTSGDRLRARRFGRFGWSGWLGVHARMMAEPRGAVAGIDAGIFRRPALDASRVVPIAAYRAVRTRLLLGAL